MMKHDPNNEGPLEEEIPAEWEAIIHNEHGFWFYHGWWFILLILILGGSGYFGVLTWKENQELIQKEGDTQLRMAALQSKIREWESWSRMIQPQIAPENTPSQPATHYGINSPDDYNPPHIADTTIINGGDAQEWHAKYSYASQKYNKLIVDYTRMHKKYMAIVGADGGGKGIITGAQFLQSLIADAKESRREVEAAISRGGDRRAMEDKRRTSKEMWDRSTWIKKIAREMGITK